MPAKPRNTLLLQETLALVAQHGSVAAAGRAAGIPNGTLQHRYLAAKAWQEQQAAPAGPAASSIPGKSVDELLLVALRQPQTLSDLAAKSGVSQGKVLDALIALQARGRNIHQFGDRWSIEREPDRGSATALDAYVSRPDGRYRFGWISDNHLGSKYARRDVLKDIYRRFGERDLDRIFNAGNYIDGEARFNKFDLLVHGMDAQVRHLIDEYPVALNGLTTYAISGDDHEGWYCQREGVDIGKYVEQQMRAAGRTDWRDLGYMEAFVPLQHAVSGARSQLHLVHPGGGSAYATSYTVQKLVESYSGGSKPAVALVGHYHKLEFINTRGVWVIQTGCTQDQTPFARKKRLNFCIGGGVAELEQDAQGAIVGAVVEMWQYFDTGYYNDRWSMAHDVALPDRGVRR
jgi:hypothetical protein